MCLSLAESAVETGTSASTLMDNMEHFYSADQDVHMCQENEQANSELEVEVDEELSVESLRDNSTWDTTRLSALMR